MSTDLNRTEIDFGEQQIFLIYFLYRFNFNFVENDGRSPVNHDAIITSTDGVTSSALAETDGVTASACAAIDTAPTNAHSATDRVTSSACTVVDGAPASSRAATDGSTTSDDSAMLEHGEK